MSSYYSARPLRFPLPAVASSCLLAIVPAMCCSFRLCNLLFVFCFTLLCPPFRFLFVYYSKSILSMLFAASSSTYASITPFALDLHSSTNQRFGHLALRTSYSHSSSRLMPRYLHVCPFPSPIRTSPMLSISI